VQFCSDVKKEFFLQLKRFLSAMLHIFPLNCKFQIAPFFRENLLVMKFAIVYFLPGKLCLVSNSAKRMQNYFLLNLIPERENISEQTLMNVVRSLNQLAKWYLLKNLFCFLKSQLLQNNKAFDTNLAIIKN
jgi:hypothetical protein